MRTRVLTAGVSACLSAVVLLGTTGCSGDDGESGADGRPGASSSRPPAPYAADLVPDDGASDGPGPVLTLTNTGQRPDRYLVQVLPPGASGVAPQVVELDPGDRATLHVLPPPSDVPRPSAGAAGKAQVVVHSASSNQDVARYLLPE